MTHPSEKVFWAGDLRFRVDIFAPATDSETLEKDIMVKFVQFFLATVLCVTKNAVVEQEGQYFLGEVHGENMFIKNKICGMPIQPIKFRIVRGHIPNRNVHAKIRKPI